MVLKQIGDGHVITIASTQRHHDQISLVIHDGVPILSLRENNDSTSGGQTRETSGGVALDTNVFTSIVILL